MSRRHTNQQQTVLAAVYEVVGAELQKHARELERRLWETRHAEEQPVAEILRQILADSVEVLGVKVTFELRDVTELIKHLGFEKEHSDEETKIDKIKPYGGE